MSVSDQLLFSDSKWEFSYLSQSDDELTMTLDVFRCHINKTELIQGLQTLIDILKGKGTHLDQGGANQSLDF